MKKDNVLISVVIVNHNGVKFLPRLLQTIYKQTTQDYEIIFVDTESKDDSLEYIKKEHPLIKVVEYENKGYGSACNIGARMGNGRFVVFLNEDMYLPDGFLKSMSDRFDEIKKSSVNIGGLSSGMLGFDANPSTDLVSTGATKTDLFGFTYPSYELDREEVFMLPGSPFFMEREVFLDIGGFSEYIFLYGEDVDLSWRANIYGYKLFVDNSTYLHHYGSAVFGAYSIKWNSLTIVSEFIPIINNYSLPSLIIILPLYMFYSLVLLFVLYIKLRFKNQIIKEYVKGIISIIRNFKGIWKFRIEVQKRRVLSDMVIFKHVSVVPAFLYKKSWTRIKGK